MATHNNLPTFSLRQRIWISGIGLVVMVGVGWSYWLTANHIPQQATQQFYNDLPDVNLSSLQPEQRASLIRVLNTTKCPCNCGMTPASCRNRDRNCQTSLKMSKEMVGKIVGGKQ